MLFTILLISNFASIFSYEPHQIRDLLKSITLKYPEAHPEILSSYFVDFINTHGLSNNQEFEDENGLAKLASFADVSANYKEFKQIWPFYLKHIDYMKKVRSRNFLTYFLHNNPVSSTLDKTSLLKDFFEAHQPTKENVKSLPQFFEFMKSFDSRCEYSSIRKIYNAVYQYQKHLEREPARIYLRKIIDNSDAKIEEIAPNLRSFITSYGLVGKNLSNIQTFKSLFYDLDFSATDVDANKIYPLVKKFGYVYTKATVREKLERHINVRERNVYEIEKEIVEFIIIYGFLDADVSNLKLFEDNIKKQDFLIIYSRLYKIHKHVYKFIKYSYMKQVTYLAIDFFEENKNITMEEVSNYIEPLIAVYNLLDLQFENVDQFKLHIRSFLGKFTRPKAMTLYTQYIEYVKYLENIESRDILLTIIENNPKIDIKNYISITDRLYKFYKLDTIDVLEFDNLVNIFRKYDSKVSDDKIITVLPILKKYRKYINEKETFERLIFRLKSKSSLLTQGTGDKPVVKELLGETIDDLLEKFIEIFQLKDYHFSLYSDFYKHFKKIYPESSDTDIKIIFDNLIVYYKYIGYIKFLNKLKPGDIRTDGTIVPPTSEDQLFWYKFFKAFGGKPHIVSNVDRFDELVFFKRWFDSVYKYFTGIYYYITPDRNSKNTEITPQTRSVSSQDTPQQQLQVARNRQL